MPHSCLGSLYTAMVSLNLGVKAQALLNKFKKCSKASTYRHTKKTIGSTAIDKRKSNPGRPPKLNARDKRAILRQVEVLRSSVGHFTSKHVRIQAGIGPNVADECVRLVLRKSELKYRHARKKGLLTRKDLKVRLAFAKKVKRKLNSDFWKKKVFPFILMESVSPTSITPVTKLVLPEPWYGDLVVRGLSLSPQTKENIKAQEAR